MSRTPIIRFKKLNRSAVLPAYAHDGDSGMDLFSVTNVSIRPGEIQTVKTGIAVQLPKNYELQVRPRSGIARNYGVTVLNSPGTIDQSYREEIFVILINHGTKVYKIKRGERFAQLVLSPLIRGDIREATILRRTDRGSGGGGSTSR